MRKLSIAIMILAAGAMPARAQGGAGPADGKAPAQVEQRLEKSGMAPADAALAHQIAREIRRYTRYTIFDDVNVGVENGVATLTGRVTMPYKIKDIGRLAARVEGVQEVNNQLKPLPVSISDDRLRRSIARQIYRDPVFSNYAIQVNPPIHIIVENGRVTLTGAVATQLERQKAEFIARSAFGAFEVQNRLRIDS